VARLIIGVAPAPVRDGGSDDAGAGVGGGGGGDEKQEQSQDVELAGGDDCAERCGQLSS
jgi:hypothetical protein